MNRLSDWLFNSRYAGAVLVLAVIVLTVLTVWLNGRMAAACQAAGGTPITTYGASGTSTVTCVGGVR